MRQIVLDTETTGLEYVQGHRLIEIGCVEMINRRITGAYFHRYLNPDREIDAGALEVHGISSEFLADKPRFDEVAEEFLTFIGGAELIIHNAAFDLGFLNHELQLLGGRYQRLEDYCGSVIDTLEVARKLHPGQRNNLDALCKRYQIDNSQRSLHGALLDAEILADVYLRMTGGQSDLLLEDTPDKNTERDKTVKSVSRSGMPLTVIAAAAEELTAHKAWLAEIDSATQGGCIWLKNLSPLKDA